MVEVEIKKFTNPLETLHGAVLCAYKKRTARNGAQLVPTDCLLKSTTTKAKNYNGLYYYAVQGVHTYWILKRLAYMTIDFQWKLKAKNVAHW